MSTWDLIFIRIGAYDVHEKLKEEFKKGQFNYNEWTKKACDELKRRGLRKHMFDEVIKFREYTPGAKEVIKTLLENDVKVGIISGSFYELGERVIKDFELENELKQKKIVIHAHCMLEFDPDSGELIRPHIEATDYEDKASLLEVFTKIFNVSPEEIAYIGDDVNDIPIMRKVGLPIAFNTHKPSVIKAAKIVINKNDLREVLPYLGIKKELKLNQLKLTEHLIKS
jgi:phosphoserine phosphatase